MTLRRSTRSRLVPIQFYSFNPEYVVSRQKANKAVVALEVPEVNKLYWSEYEERKLYKCTLGLIPDQHNYYCSYGIPVRAFSFLK